MTPKINFRDYSFTELKYNIEVLQPIFKAGKMSNGMQKVYFNLKREYESRTQGEIELNTYQLKFAI